MARKLLSVVIPVLNEQDNIEPLYEALVPVLDSLSGRLDSEIIFTDDHSTDKSFDLLSGLARRDRRVRVYRFSRRFGFQRSIMTAYHQARGDIVVQLDCDLQDPPELIPEFVRKWEEGYQVVYGVRRSRQEGWLITRCRAVFYALLDALSEYPLPRQAGDFRLVARPLIEELKKIDEPYPYLRGMIAGLGFNQIGIPYDRRKRERGESKFPFRNLVTLAIDGLLNTSVIPLRLATYAGFLISALTSLAVIYYLVAALLYGRSTWPSGFATITIFILLSLSVNAVFLGIIGEYLGRTYSHVKRRPLTIIEQSIESSHSSSADPRPDQRSDE